MSGQSQDSKTRTSSIKVQYSTHTVEVQQLELTGDYARLSGPQRDLLQDTIVASIPVLSERANQLASSRRATHQAAPSGSVQRGGQSGRMIQAGEQFTGQASDGGDSGNSISVPVIFTDTKEALPYVYGQFFANSLADTVRKHADSIRFGIPPVDDGRIQQLRSNALTDRALAMYDGQNMWGDEFALAGAGHGGGSQPRSSGI